MNDKLAAQAAYGARPKVELKVLDKRLGSEFPLPQYETSDAAGMDLRAMVDSPFTLEPGETKLVPAGFAMHLGTPHLTAVLVPRSGLGSKRGIVLANLVGIVDSGYVGEVGICLWNRGTEPVTIQQGERVAQMLIVPVVQVDWELVDELATTERGAGGFGSTGVG